MRTVTGLVGMEYGIKGFQGSKGFCLESMSTESGNLGVKILLVPDMCSLLAERKRDTKGVQRTARAADVQRRERQAMQALQKNVKSQEEPVRNFLTACESCDNDLRDALVQEACSERRTVLYALVLLAKHWTQAFHDSAGWSCNKNRPVRE